MPRHGARRRHRDNAPSANSGDRLDAIPVHPCLICGACCAAQRVLFHRDHVEPTGLVPAWLVVPSQTRDHVRARGTLGSEPRCIALDGEIGARVACTIYERRPPPCRDFAASFEAGVVEPDCDAARARHGLPPLTPADWGR